MCIRDRILVYGHRGGATDENVSRPISALEIIMIIETRILSPICTLSPHAYNQTVVTTIMRGFLHFHFHFRLRGVRMEGAFSPETCYDGGCTFRSKSCLRLKLKPRYLSSRGYLSKEPQKKKCTPTVACLPERTGTPKKRSKTSRRRGGKHPPKLCYDA